MKLLSRPLLLSSFRGPIPRLRYGQLIRKIHSDGIQSLTTISEYHCDPDTKKYLPWGFLVYRCTYRDDKAWQRMVQYIQDHAQSWLESEQRTDLIPSHDPVFLNDKTKFDGATSHDVRDHFDIWAQAQTSQTNDPSWFKYAARYEFCVFVDDICLESLVHMEDDPVVKILCRGSGYLPPEERNYQVHPEWEDGVTDDPEEYVGWIYVRAREYVWWYDWLCEDWQWPDMYNRPPILLFQNQDKWPGFWRKTQKRNS
ncbi:hypothetical protein HFD88_004728 [Aspergillus terreus]|nr:hypothetical protein HFD88_004728 [Aspergillus terreus]